MENKGITLLLFLAGGKMTQTITKMNNDTVIAHLLKDCKIRSPMHMSYLIFLLQIFSKEEVSQML